MPDGRSRPSTRRAGGILARRDLETHVEAVKKHDIGYIDVVAVNLYPFRETVAAGGDFA